MYLFLFNSLLFDFALFFRMMRQLEVPAGCTILADQAYPDELPLLVTGQGRGRELRAARVRVEHCLHDIKIFRSAGVRSRHRRRTVPSMFATATGLRNMRRSTFWRANVLLSWIFSCTYYLQGTLKKALRLQSLSMVMLLFQNTFVCKICCPTYEGTSNTTNETKDWIFLI